MSSEFLLPRVGTKDDPIRLAVFISGGGSGLKSLIEYQKTPRAHITSLVISENNNAGGLEIAEKNKVLGFHVPLPPISDKSEMRLEHEKQIQQILENENSELIVLSGYMRIISPWLISKWKGRIVNIHPSLLPDFPGAHAHRDVLAAGSNLSGCTVHLVDEGVDTGPILGQSRVAVYPDDNIKSLQERVKIEEHKLYPKILDDICTGLISI